MGFAPRAGKAPKRLPDELGPACGASLPLLPPSSPEGRVAQRNPYPQEQVFFCADGFKGRGNQRRLEP